ncbi:MAG TPA: hypothetical protein DCF44_05660, partial [Chitinophagaceae bacterium]|nr:hypothetical protein [Chitinophagaceae bacterium]
CAKQQKWKCKNFFHVGIFKCRVMCKKSIKGQIGKRKKERFIAMYFFWTQKCHQLSWWYF